MELKSLNCNNCGAQLDVPEVAKFVTCGHCDSRLAIRHTESVWYTEKIEQLTAATTDIARQVARMAYLNKLDRIDKEWEEEQSLYTSQNKGGRPTIPLDKMQTTIVMAIGGAVMLLVGLMKSDWPLVAVGLLLLTFGSYAAWLAKRRQEAYEQAHQEYLRRRAKVRLEDFMPDLGSDKQDAATAG